MGESLKAQHLRQLMRTAQKLRRAADATSDAHYVGLFLRAAAAVEHRATEIANAPDDDGEDLSFDEALDAARSHVDLRI